MIDNVIKQMRNIPELSWHSPAPEDVFSELISTQGIRLPESHVQLLQRSNGIEAYGGYIRLFGLKTKDSIDMLDWNEIDSWKFAWPEILKEYWCFGGTAWGDQIAYKIVELRERLEPQVYFLDSVLMKPVVLLESFDKYMNLGFIQNAREPLVEMTRLARKKLGALSRMEHVIYNPSLLLTNEENIDFVEKMPAYSAMIANGDLYMQLAHETFDRTVKSIESYLDIKGRSRIRVVWENVN